jgi:hypothetical protein
MPIHLPPVSRRRFLAGLTTGVGTLAASEALWANDADVDDDLIAILNDTHIGEKQKLDAPIPANLAATVQFLVGLKRRPAAVLINGDLALKDAQEGDYKVFAQLVQPLRQAGLSVHLTMGNHDNREVFFKMLAEEKAPNPPVASRHVSLGSDPFSELSAPRFPQGDDDRPRRFRHGAACLARSSTLGSPAETRDHRRASQPASRRRPRAFPGRADRL